MASTRNEPCPCGSGKKYKACCAVRRGARQWIAPAAVVIFLGLAIWVVVGAVRGAARAKAVRAPEEQGRVWSEEHGHWHYEENRGAARPSGPAPPGKVWSAEHGHWHDAEVAGVPQAPAGAPPGKVWSEEHGHWHDAPAPAGQGSAADAPEAGVSSVDGP